MAEFDKVGTSSLTTRTTNDIMQIQDFSIMMFRVVILAPLMCAGGIALAIQKNMQLAWVIIACMPLILVFLIIVMRKAFPVFRSMQSKLDGLNVVMRENITGVRVAPRGVRTIAVDIFVRDKDRDVYKRQLFACSFRDCVKHSRNEFCLAPR